MKIVLDTNIIVSAFINPKGAPGEITSLNTRVAMQIILSQETRNIFPKKRI
jgi:predicted nucleic acid-binding protein